jgi:hypothetical protein
MTESDQSTLLAVLRKCAREARIGAQIDPRRLDAILVAWAGERPLLRARLMELVTIANGHILVGSHDTALKSLREAIRIVEITPALIEEEPNFKEHELSEATAEVESAN